MKVLVIGWAATGSHFFARAFENDKRKYYGCLFQYSKLPLMDENGKYIYHIKENPEILKFKSIEERVKLALNYYNFVDYHNKNQHIWKLSTNDIFYHDKFTKYIIQNSDVIIYTRRSLIDSILARNVSRQTGIDNVHINQNIDDILTEKHYINWNYRDDKILKDFEIYKSWHDGIMKFSESENFYIRKYCNNLKSEYKDWFNKQFFINLDLVEKLMLKKSTIKNFQNNIILNYDIEEKREHIKNLIIERFGKNESSNIIEGTT